MSAVAVADTALGIQFAAVGVPRPEGSTAFKGMRGGKPIILHDDPQLPAWRNTVGYAARRAMAGKPPWEGPIRLELVFVVQRPQKMPTGRLAPVVKPDLDKLVRAIGDALNRIVYSDDAQVTELTARKRYPVDGREQCGVIVHAMPLGPQQVALPF